MMGHVMGSVTGPMPGTDLWTLATIAGMACITVLARCFFFISSKPWQLPAWAQRGLPYAPIAAMAAVVVPEALLQQGHWPSTWRDARFFAAAAAALYFYLRRFYTQRQAPSVASNPMLGAMVCGMLVYLPLHLGWAW